MTRTPPAPVHAFAPYADRVSPDDRGHTPEGLVRWLALLIFFLLEPINAIRLLRYGRVSWLWLGRPDLPAGSAQAEAAAIRGSFGTAIAWMCLRRGIGPGHKDWPDMARAIVAYGGSVARFRPGLPPFGLQWWENPYIVEGMTSLETPPAASRAVVMPLEDCPGDVPCVMDAVMDAVRAGATHARLPASWLAASRQRVFARAGPGPSTGPPFRPGLPLSVVFDARGRSMASPAALIRAA